MPDPATQFQSAGLNIPYVYTPVETRLNPPIHLDPVNYDALQRGLQAIPDMLMKSPLNPAVRSQIQAETARYNLEKAAIANVSQMSPEEQARRIGVSQGGAEIVPGYQTGNIGVPPAAPSGPQDNQQQPQGDQQQQTTQQPTDNQPQTAGQVTGTPSSTGQQFGSNYPMPGQQPQQGQIQQKQEPTSPYQIPKTIAAPPAPGGNQQPQPATNQNQGIVYQPGAGQPSQQDLLAWQNQNAHPVMNSQDALNWAKGFDTAIRRATYLPHGGPNGEPAFAFSDGKSQNVVPLSQIRQNGGQGLIAGQNTSQVLNTAQQVSNQQQPEPQPPLAQQPSAGALAVAQQQANQFGQYGNQTVPPAPGQFTPEQKAYIASQTGDVSVLAADTNNNFLLQKNAQQNAQRGDIQLAPNTIRDGLSNTPRSTDPLSHDPIPPGEQPGQANQAVNSLLAEVQKRPGGLNTLEDAGPEHPGVKKLGGPTTAGVQWFVDSNPDPNNPDSHLPFLITQTSPWSEKRMYNTVGNEWIPTEVVRPDRVLDKQIMDNLHQDSTDWKLPNGQPDQARKIQALRDDYNLHNTIPMTQDVQGKLESMRSQVLQSQRIMEGIRDGKMTDNDWGWFRQIQNSVADNANVLGGSHADAFVRELARKIAPGGVDPKLQYLGNAYATLIKGREDPNLSPQERAELDHVTMGTSLPTQIQQLNHSRMVEYNRYYNQAVANRMRIADDYMGTADEITSKHRMHDGGMPDFSTLPNVRSGLPPGAPPGNSPMVLRAQPVTPTPQPTPTPTPMPVPANNSQQAPLDLSGFNRNDQISKARQLPRGTWVKSGNNVFPVP